jgi:competence protein ComEA
MDLTKREKIGLIVFIFIILLIVSVMYFNKNKSETVEVISKDKVEAAAPENSGNAAKSKSEITVYINGEIKKPGVYTLKDGERAEKLVELAGGFTNNADPSLINLSMKLKDEDFIKIPSKLQTASATGISGNTNTTQGEPAALININTADKEQLKELPRIGDAIAQRIIDYREKSGFFKDIKNITDVSGIGPKMFENIKDKITVH